MAPHKGNILLRPLAKPAIHLALGLALLFIVVAEVQYRFVRWEAFNAATQELAAYGKQIVAELGYAAANRWNLKGYRQASIDAPAWYVIASNGLVLDIEGSLVSMFGQVKVVDGLEYGRAQTLTSPVGERWRLLGKRVEGGLVLLGISDPPDLAYADQLLTTNLAKFGQALDQAAKLKAREVDAEVDYAVLSDSGQLKTAWGGVPLVTDPAPLAALAVSREPFSISRTPYLLAAEPILLSSKAAVGTVFTSKDMSAVLRTLREDFWFNLGVALISFLVAVALALYFSWRDLRSRARHVSLEEALRQPQESQNVEFKPGFYMEPTQPFHTREGPFEVLKTVAGFLNAGGGTLFVGVSNNGAVCGIDPDLKRFRDSRDELERDIINQITSKIGPEFAQFVEHRFELFEGKPVLILDVNPSPKPAFARRNNQTAFFVRQGGQTRPLDPQEQHDYTRSHWRA